MRKTVPGALAALLISMFLAAPSGTTAAPSEKEYVVLYAEGASLKAAHAAVRQAGGRIVDEIGSIGVAKAVSTRADFASAANKQAALAGATLNRVIGYAPGAGLDRKRSVEKADETSAQRAAAYAQAATGEPLASLQWDMDMINATASESHAEQPGNPGVLVGIIDTGIDGSHPDLAPNFDAIRSRNFTRDRPDIDGPCKQDPDGSCTDPNNVDEAGHGTHVAGTVAAAINGIGIAGVAPSVRLVNIRAGQDSGFFFLFETINAITYAGDIGVDVVNMSFFTDPWLYNCPVDHPAPEDSLEARNEQQISIDAHQRALHYATAHNVTLIASAGNEHRDMGNPRSPDIISPDYPEGTEYPRTITNHCLVLPTEGDGVMSISALGPSELKADYSNWGTEQITVSAPGGYARDRFGTPQYNAVENRVLSTYPQALLKETHEINGKGEPTTPFVVRYCSNPRVKSTCSYYRYLQGTSMASPHAVGVAALIVSEYGTPTSGGLTMSPAVVQQKLQDTARDHACPGPVFDYPDRDAEWTSNCDGDAGFNGWYGHGIVDALGAVTP